mgnify:CR=1 FL=1
MLEQLTAKIGSAEAQGLRAAHGEPLEVLSSGINAFDSLLPGGGLPRGRLSELSGARSSGKRALATAFCATALAAGRNVIWIDARGALGRFTPICALEAGLPLDRLLVLRPRPKVDPRDSLTKAAYRAADLVLGCGPAVALLVIELPCFGELRGSRQASKLSRLSRAAEASATALLFISEKSASRGSLGTFVALHIGVQRSPEAGSRAGALQLTVVKSKLGNMAHRAEVALDEPHGVRLDSTV